MALGFIRKAWRATTKPRREKIKIKAMRTSSTAKKGDTPRNISRIGMLLSMAEMTKTFNPTGGVISPSSTTIRHKNAKPYFQSVNIHAEGGGVGAYPFAAVNRR